ncbi:hypothetical protein ACIGT4_04095 [Streptomyces sioyaensis]|uniref:hypothetical protein n=1 Tax=Streptomyces sioyaensis TaxID=67364 RepID=UPI0037D310C2
MGRSVSVTTRPAATDRDQYAERLATDHGHRPGRLLAEDLLIPVAGNLTAEWDEQLKVGVIDADYDEENGLGEIRH